MKRKFRSMAVMLMLALTAVTIVLLINLVGIMLVIALLTLPAAAAGCCTSRLKSMMIVSALFNGFFVVSGLLASSMLSLPSGPTVVVISGAVYIAVLAVKKLRNK